MARSTTPAPAFDVSALSIQEAELPANTRERKVKDNPFVPALTESYEQETGRQVTVPAQNTQQVLYLIRQAANDLGIGARIVVQNNKGETVEQRKDALKALRGNVTVKFAGKDRTQRRNNGSESNDASE